MYIAAFVFNEREITARGPFYTGGAAKAYARTMSTDPDEALVIHIQKPDPSVHTGFLSDEDADDMAADGR